MDRFDSLLLFTRIVEAGSFSKAAAMLEIPRATATNAIKELEARLSTRLLERTTRQVRPTPDGQAFYERCVHVLEDLDDAEGSLRHAAANPRGVLRVDLTGVQATRIVLPAIDDFRARYPQLNLVVGTGDRVVDLVREGVDCVIRSGEPKDSTLIARRLADMPQVICASPGYLAKAGVPAEPRDLLKHQAVKFFASAGNVSYPFELVVDGQVRAFDLQGWISVNDSENYVACALRDAGFIQLPRFHVEDELRAGRLVEVLPEWDKPTMAVSAMYPFGRQLSPRVRVFVDWVAGLYAKKFGAVSARWGSSAKPPSLPEAA